MCANHSLSPAERRAALRVFKRRGCVPQVGTLETVIAGCSALLDDGLAPPSVSGAAGTPHALAAYLELFLDALAHAGATDGVPNSSIVSAAAADAAIARVRTVLQRAAIAAGGGVTGARGGGENAAAVELVDVFRAPRWQKGGAGVARSVVDGMARPTATGAVVNAMPTVKAEVFRARYELVLERTLRNPRFAPPATGTGLHYLAAGTREGSPYLRLTAIDSLVNATEQDCLVLGMLTQLEVGNWYLEDLHGSIQLDLSEAHTTAGLHTDGSFVIAQGRMVDLEAVDVEGRRQYVFKVFALGTPPLEDRDTSLQALGKSANLFGGHYDPTEVPHLLSIEQDSTDAMFLIFSDVHLDNPRVISGVQHVLAGYLEDGLVPTLVVLMGNFLSHPFGQQSGDMAKLTALFKEFGEALAASFPQLNGETVFLVIPGPGDAGPGNLLPRPAMPRCITRGFAETLGPKNVLFGTNPARVRFLTQELVFLREDLLQKMLRHCAVRPDTTDTTFMAEHMVKSVVDQGHLCPLPLSSRPLLWAHDHVMWLFPAPHVVAIADKVDSFTFKYGGTLGLNPGSFGADFSFCMYIPFERRSQQCTLHPDDLLEGGEAESEEKEGRNT